jgi:hypothetical protein
MGIPKGETSKCLLFEFLSIVNALLLVEFKVSIMKLAKVSYFFADSDQIVRMLE